VAAVEVPDRGSDFEGMKSSAFVLTEKKRSGSGLIDNQLYFG